MRVDPSPKDRVRRFNHRRRGLATIATTAILLSAVSVMGTSTVAWSQANLDSREQAMESEYSSVINQIKESLVLENIWYKTSEQKLKITLKNTGTIGLTVIEIKIDGTNRQVTPIANAEILPDDVYQIDIQYDWLGDPIDLFVTTDRGSIFRMHVEPPTQGKLIINKVSMLGDGSFNYTGDLGLFNIQTSGFSGVTLNPDGSLVLAGTIRDFNGTGPGVMGAHPDFQKDPICGLMYGIVLPTLGNGSKPVYAGPNSCTTNQTNFDKWYRDDPINKKMAYSIKLDRVVGSVPPTWIYDSTKDASLNYKFFPIDGQLFGNTPGWPRNYHFTYEIHNTFTYQGNEMFNFTGDDDVWVFINNKLAVDIGGVHPVKQGLVILNNTKAAELGLVVGNDYPFDFFFAERHTTESNFVITTSIQLGNNGVGRTSVFFVDPGEYTVNELVPSGWTLVGRQCDNGYTLPNSTAMIVTVPKGVTTCTFTNTK